MVELSRSNKTFRVIYGILIAFALLIVINALTVHYIGTVLVSFSKALILGLICLIYGRVFLLFIKHKAVSIEISFGTGLIITTFYFFLPGFFQQLTPLWFYAYIVMAVPAGIFLVKKKAIKLKHVFKPFDKLYRAYLIFLFPLFYAALPPSFFDTLVYHLGIPNLYVQNGGFCATPQFLYANTSVYYEVSLIPSVFSGTFVPRFFHLIVGMVLVLAVVNFARDYLRIRSRLLLPVLIITLPVSGFLLTAVKNDLPGALFILLGIRCLLREHYAGAGVFWGFAVGIKYFNALPLAIFLGLFLIFQKKFPIKQYLHFFLAFLIVLTPLFIKNIIYPGNPVFPFFHSLFPSGYWDASRSRLMARDVGRICKSWKDFLYLPYNLSFKEFGSGGRVGIQFLVFLPFLLLFRREGTDRISNGSSGERALLFWFSLITIFVGCCFTGSVRFLFLPLLLLCLFVVWVYEQQPRGFIKILMVVVLLLNSVSSVALLNYLYSPQLLYTQQLNPDEYITRTFPAYPAIKFLNFHTPKDSVVLLAGETRNYYLKRKYRVSSAIDYSILKPYLEKADNLAEWLALLRADGFDYLLVNFPEFNRLNRQYDRLPLSLRQMAVSFFKQLKPVFQDRGVYVFRLK